MASFWAIHLSFYLFLIGIVIILAQNYLLKQGIDSEGNVFIYSPYILWNSQINPSPNPLNTPLKIYSANGQLNITFQVRANRVENELFSFTTRSFCYADLCSLPAPTLYVMPGDVLNIDLINELDATYTNNSGSSGGGFPDEIFFPNRTNIFIAGIPLDPLVNSPFNYVEGGNTVYNYSHLIPEDMVPGVYWYHSRVHKVAALQVMNGLFGALFVIPRNTTIYPKNYNQIDHETFVFSHILLEEPSNIYLANTQSNSFSFLDDDYFTSSLSLSYLSSLYGSNLPLDIVYTNNFTYETNQQSSNVPIFDAWFTNGQYQPVMTLPPGKWEIFDLIVASGDRMIELELKDLVGNVGTGNYSCTVQLIAKNGVSYRFPRNDSYVRHLTLLASETASIVVMCPTAGVYYLQSSTVISPAVNMSADPLQDFGQIGDYQTKSSQLLVIFNITGEEYYMDDPPTDYSFIIESVPGNGDAYFVSSDSSQSFYEGDPPSATVSFSLSTAQWRPAPSSASNSVNAVSCFELSSTEGNTSFASNAEMLLGVGPNCQLPCYEDLLCTALYGTSNYPINTFPTVQAGECSYGSSSKDAVGSVDSDCATIPANVTGDNPINSTFPGLYILQTSIDQASVLNNSIYVNLDIFGHEDYQYPLFFQQQYLQFHSFENVNINISNIVQRDEYQPVYQYQTSYYYRENDWQNLIVPLPGRTSFTMKVNLNNNPNGIFYILTSFLKYEDRGLLRVVQFEPNILLPSPSTSSSPSLQGMNETNTKNTTNPSSSWIVTPESVRDNLDAANSTYVCNVTGASFYYEEKIDFVLQTRTLQINSCPNHFSVCQSSECGGALKSRALKNAETFVVPLYPRLRSQPVDMSCTDSLPVAIALNGVKIYSPAEVEKEACVSYPPSQYNQSLLYGRTQCQVSSRNPGILECGNRLKTVGTIVDKCGGFADITYSDGEYRYLMLPTCLLSQLTAQQQSQQQEYSQVSNSGGNITWISSQGSISTNRGYKPRQHSPQIAWALDGFPVYGPYGPKGIIMRRCGSLYAHPQICVDTCNGYYGQLPDVDSYYYRYYVLGNLTSTQCSSIIRNLPSPDSCQRFQSKCCISSIPDDSFYPYVPTCFRGCLYNYPGDPRYNCTVAELDENNLYATSRGYSSSFLPSLSNYPTTIFTDNLAAIAMMISDDSTSPFSNDSSSSPSPANGTGSAFSNVSSLQVPFNQKKVLMLNEFDRRLMLLSYNQSRANEIDSSAVLFDRGKNDFYLTGMAFDRSHSNLYLTSQSAIYSYNIEKKVLSKVIAGIIQVDIVGYNLGNEREDVQSIFLNQSYACTSIIRFNATNLRCLFYQPAVLQIFAAFNQTIPPWLMEVRTISGVARGIALDAMNIVKGNVLRPVITQITSQQYPFIPYALSIIDATLYWTNIAASARSVQRALLDGSSIETVLVNVKKGSSIAVIPGYVDSSLSFVGLSFPSTNASSLNCSAAPYYPSTTNPPPVNSNCLYYAHILFISDYDQETVFQVNVLPINSNDYVFLLDPVPLVTANTTSINGSITGEANTMILSSQLQYQDQSNPASGNILPIYSLFTGLTKIRTVFVDLSTKEIYLVAAEGVILRTSLLIVLTSQVIQQLNLQTNILPLTWPINIPITSLIFNQPSSFSGGTALLPWWMEVIYIGTADSRLQGIATLPAPSLANGEVTAPSQLWNQERIFALDSNQELFVSILQEGIDHQDLQLGLIFNVQWPSAILFSRSWPSSSSSNPETVIIEYYLSEYLGKVWRLTVKQDQSTGKVDYSESVPQLVLDVSTFTTSVLLRSQLNKAFQQDLSSKDLIFYEISV